MHFLHFTIKIEQLSRGIQVHGLVIILIPYNLLVNLSIIIIHSSDNPFNECIL